jgi:muconolactone delta-isomerase
MSWRQGAGQALIYAATVRARAAAALSLLAGTVGVTRQSWRKLGRWTDLSLAQKRL